MPGEFGSWELLVGAEAGFGAAHLIPEVRGFVFIFIFLRRETSVSVNLK